MKYRKWTSVFCLFVLTLFFSVSPVLAKDDTLEITNYINDYANLIDSNTENELNQAGHEFEEKTGAQIVFITVDSLDGQDIRQVAYRTFRKYELGDKDQDNGILFIVSMQDKQRYMEVGTGLEGTITDIASQHLQTEYLVPYFQNEEYQVGLEKLYYQTIDAIQNGIDEGALQAATQEEESDLAYTIISMIPIAFILLIAFAMAFSKNSASMSAIYLVPSQRYRLNIRDYDFDEESIIISSDDPSIVSVEASGWITAHSIGQTKIHLQKIDEDAPKDIPVVVSQDSGGTRRRNNDDILDYLIWGSILNNRSRRSSYRSRGGYGGFGGSGGFGGFSGGGGGSRGGGAGGSW